MSDLKTMSEAVRRVIEDYPVGYQFHGNQLHEDVALLYPPARTMYTDTLMRMMRRHCKHQYKTVDQNRSLYEKTQFEFVIERIKETVPKEVKTIIPSGPMKQGELPFFNQGFLVVFCVVFFGLAFGLFFSGEFAFGCPLSERLFSISKSSFVSSNIALTPIYREGSYLARCSLLRAASVETGSFGLLSFCPTSKTVYSIHLLYRQLVDKNQVAYVQKSDILTILLYRRIVILQKFCKFSEISFQNLDKAIGLG